MNKKEKKTEDFCRNIAILELNQVTEEKKITVTTLIIGAKQDKYCFNKCRYTVC